jgi:hypothetical protein
MYITLRLARPAGGEPSGGWRCTCGVLYCQVHRPACWGAAQPPHAAGRCSIRLSEAEVRVGVLFAVVTGVLVLQG